jgi:hypothetical protein
MAHAVAVAVAVAASIVSLQQRGGIGGLGGLGSLPVYDTQETIRFSCPKQAEEASVFWMKH